MINILPDHIKEERRYGRLNRFLLKQVVGAVFIGALAVGFMLTGLQLVRNDEQVLRDAIAEKEVRYESVRAVETEAKQFDAQLDAIQKLFDKEVKFSVLLQQIASSLPLNTRLKSLSLTGTKSEPLQIVAEVDSQELAAVLRKSLVDSDTFESADILSIVPGETSETGVIVNYDVTINAEFTGAAEARAKEKAAQEAADAASRAAAQDQDAGGAE